MQVQRFRRASIGLFSGVVLFGAANAFGQLRVVTYNDSGDNNAAGVNANTAAFTAILKAIGDETRNGIAKPIDVITLSEQSLDLTTADKVVTDLNSLYGAGTYAKSTVGGLGDTTEAVVYNTKTLTLNASTAFGTSSVSSGDQSQPARQGLRYQFTPVGYSASSTFYVYADHFKASSGGSLSDPTSNVARRNTEAAEVRANSDALGANVRAIYTGDFNLYTSAEPAWATLTAAGNGQASDPANSVGAWDNNASFASVHTQSPTTTFRYSGQVTGGMDSRFDFELATSALTSGHGLSFIPNSYRAFGNAGVQYGKDIDTSGAATALFNAGYFPGYTTAQIQTILTDLGNASDHIPVVSDYRLPAKIGLALSTVPARVAIGATGTPATVTATVSNAAPVSFSNGAEVLSYTVAGTAGLSGSASSTATALAAGSATGLTIDTTTSGSKTSTVTVTSANVGEPNGGTLSQNAIYSVLDKRVVTASTVDAGRLMKGSSYTASGLTTNLSTTGTDATTTRVTVAGGAELYNSPTSTGSRNVGGLVSASTGTLTTLGVTTAENSGAGIGDTGANGYAALSVFYTATLFDPARVLTSGSTYAKSGNTATVSGTNPNYVIGTTGDFSPSSSGHVDVAGSLNVSPSYFLLNIDGTADTQTMRDNVVAALVADGISSSDVSDDPAAFNNMLTKYQFTSDYDVAVRFTLPNTTGNFQFEYDLSQVSANGTAFGNAGFQSVALTNVGVVPEPASLALVAFGAATLLTRRRRSRVVSSY